MSELVSIKQLADRFQISEAATAAYIKASSLKTHQLTLGTETVFLYDKAEAGRVVETKLNEDRRVAAAAAEAARKAAEEAAREPTMKELGNAIKSLTTITTDMEITVDTLLVHVEKICEQNKLLFRELQKLTNPEPVQVQVIEAQEKAPKVTRIKVAVYSVQSNLPTLVGREYDEFLDIEYINLKSKKLTVSARSDKVLMMTACVSTSTINDVSKSAGDRFIRINGSVTELRDVLTELYLNASAEVAEV